MKKTTKAKKAKKVDLDLDQALMEIAKTLRPVAARGEEPYDGGGSEVNGSCHAQSGIQSWVGHN